MIAQSGLGFQQREGQLFFSVKKFRRQTLFSVFKGPIFMHEHEQTIKGVRKAFRLTAYFMS